MIDIINSVLCIDSIHIINIALLFFIYSHYIYKSDLVEQWEMF